MREAYAFGKCVAVHAHATAAIVQAVAAEAETVEHGLWLDDQTGFFRLEERTVERMAAQGTFVVPTLARFFPRRAAADSGDPLMRDIEPLLPLFARMREAGVRLVAGNDTGASYTPFTDLVHGLELMARFGMAPAELVRAATLTAAGAAAFAAAGSPAGLADGAAGAGAAGAAGCGAAHASTSKPLSARAAPRTQRMGPPPCAPFPRSREPSAARVGR